MDDPNLAMAAAVAVAVAATNNMQQQDAQQQHEGQPDVVNTEGQPDVVNTEGQPEAHAEVVNAANTANAANADGPEQSTVIGVEPSIVNTTRPRKSDSTTGVQLANAEPYHTKRTTQFNDQGQPDDAEETNTTDELIKHNLKQVNQAQGEYNEKQQNHRLTSEKLDESAASLGLLQKNINTTKQEIEQLQKTNADNELNHATIISKLTGKLKRLETILNEKTEALKQVNKQIDTN